MTLTPAQRALRARIAANSRVSDPNYDGRKATASATHGYWQRYYDRVDPDRTLSPEARDRKAKAAWQSDMDRAKLARSKKRKR